jgi:hypothetical protein
MGSAFAVFYQGCGAIYHFIVAPGSLMIDATGSEEWHDLCYCSRPGNVGSILH